jgi:16S rRNA processing protein RimM
VDERQVLLGRIVGVFGVDGWVKLLSFTEPRDNIFKYRPWTVRGAGTELTVARPQGRMQGKGVVARLPDVADRDAAAALVGREIFVPRALLPDAAQGEYYWADLEGLEVRTLDGTSLGRVSHLFATGANDVMVVQGERERLLPFVPGQQVVRVDLDAGLIEVDWDPAF